MKNGKLVILSGGISSRMKKAIDQKLNIDEKLLHDADDKSKSMIGVGENYRPFLDYLLYNASISGYSDVALVIGQNDNSIKQYYGEAEENHFKGMKITYSTQIIPEGRSKPLGTADALLQGLRSKPEWHGKKFTVCNSDNLYSMKALTLMLNSPYDGALIDYDRAALDFDQSRIERFAVTVKNKKGFITDIIEKPDTEIIERLKDEQGFIGVSMNIFSLNYNMIFPILERVPLHPIRQEKELPNAVKILADEIDNSVYAYPLAEHVPDLTSKDDILDVKNYLEKFYKDFI